MIANDIPSVPSNQHGTNHSIEFKDVPPYHSSVTTDRTSPRLQMHPTPPPRYLYSIALSSNKHQTEQPLDEGNRSISDSILPEIYRIRDYMLWSQLSLVLGCVVLGIPALLLAMKTRQYKRTSDIAKARMLSRITVVVNIFISCLFACSMICLMIYLSLKC